MWRELQRLARRRCIAKIELCAGRRAGRILAGSTVVVLLLVLADGVVAASYGRAGLTLAAQSLAAGASQRLLTQPAMLTAVHQRLIRAHADLYRAHLAILPWTPMLGVLHRLPAYGPAIASISPMLASATCLVGAAAETSQVAEALVAAETSNAGIQRDGRTAVQTLDREQPSIDAAQEQLACAIASRKRVDPRLNSAPDRLGPALAQLDGSLRKASGVIGTLALLPPAAHALLGIDTPRQYLVLGQDPFELRATGGFIGALGLVTVGNGAITALDYRGVLGFEPPNQRRLEPPPPLVKYMGLSGWYLRDANWSPDFPTAARQVEEFFRLDQGKQVDGVIALDLYALQDLLAVVGPIDLPDYHETVTAGTLLPQLWEHINASGSVTPPREQAKTDYLTALAGALLLRLQQPAAVTIPTLLSALLPAVQERHVQVYMADPTLEALATLAHADGAVWDGPGDSLAVVDAHVSYAKMAAVVDESVALDVTIGANGQVTSDVLTVTYSNNYATLGAQRVWRELHSELFDFHTGAFISGAGIFATYVRVLTPFGSTLSSVQGGDDAPGLAQADGHSEISTYLVVRPTESRKLRVTYAPHITGVATNRYQLTVQKQPGTVAEPLVVHLHMPAALRVNAPLPGWTAEGSTTWQYRGDLRQGRRLAFQWRVPS